MFYQKPRKMTTDGMRPRTRVNNGVNKVVNKVNNGDESVNSKQVAELFEEMERNEEIKKLEIKKLRDDGDGETRDPSASLDTARDRSLRAGEKRGRKRFGRLVKVFAVVIFVVVVFLVNSWFDFIPLGKTSGSRVMEISGSEKSGWEAVFLTNGQVYFGKIDKIDDGFVLMRDIYYLKSKSKSTNESESTNSTNVTDDVGDGGTKLVKFGTEAHKPIDELKINIQHILMIEELSVESEIVRAIISQ